MPPVIVSLTSTEARNGTLFPTIESIWNQTHKPDDIRLYTTLDLEVDVKDLPVERLILPGKDRGPITKLGAVMDLVVPKDSIIVTVDDDIIYEPTWLETLLDGFDRFCLRNAVGMSGWRRSPKPISFVTSTPATVDVLEGYAGVAYKKSWFGSDIWDIPPEFRTVDDVWISAYLNRKSIPRVQLCSPMCRTGKLPGLHNDPTFLDTNRRAARELFA